MEWSTSCKDWEDRIIKEKSLIPFEPLFPKVADRAWRIFSQLRVVDVPGCPTFGEISRPWVKDLVCAIFGAYDEDNGRMLIREFFLFVSKKNSKSTLAAAIMMTALILNWRDSAEFIILAPTVKVAANSFSPAYNMCREDVDKDLYDLMHVQDHYKRIKNLNSNAFLNVVAADSQTVSGIKATGVFIDEIHEFGKRDKSEGMLIEATGGLMSRPEGFIIYATTQSEDPPAGIFAKKLEYARKVRDGEIKDNTFLPILYEFPKHILDQKLHLNPKYFYITNPNLGSSVDENYLERTYKQEVENGKDSVQKFIAKHLNVQVGMSLKTQRWTGADFWEKAKGDVTIETIFKTCEVIVMGVDGGGLDDLLGVAVIGRHAETRDWLLWVKAWMHPIALERRKSEASKYRDFAKDGDLVIVDHVGQDVKEMGDLVMLCEKSGLLDRIGFDPYCVGDIVDEIEARELPKINPNSKEHDRLIRVPQGWQLSGAIQTMERRVAGTEESGKKLIHGGQPLMAWCVGNAKCETRGNNLYVTKQISGRAKIDPLMAAFDAVALMAMNPEARRAKITDDYEATVW